MTIELDNNNHSFYKLTYHLILVTKFRRNLFDRTVSNYAKQVFKKIGESYDIEINKWRYQPDYIHITFTTNPRTDLPKFINAYKSASSRLIKADYPGLVHEMWESIFWSKSYCLITSEYATKEVIDAFVERQGGNNK